MKKDDIKKINVTNSSLRKSFCNVRYMLNKLLINVDIALTVRFNNIAIQAAS